jgi:hypothetical protein
MSHNAWLDIFMGHLICRIACEHLFIKVCHLFTIFLLFSRFGIQIIIQIWHLFQKSWA